jgi:hypothetical protein
MHRDWVTATATVIAAIIGIFGGYLLSRWQREKREVRFVLTETEDLAAALRQHGNFEIKFADFSTTELVLSTIAIRNLGNRSVENLQFSIKLPGKHSFAKINCASANTALTEQIVVSSPPNGADQAFAVSLPFFNRGESFRINALYSGPAIDPQVICRLPDTNVSIVTFSELSRRTVARNRWFGFAGFIIGISGGIAAAAVRQLVSH